MSFLYIRKILPISISALALGLFISMFAVPQRAQASSLTIAPLRSELDITPGQTYTQTLTVQNTGKTPEHLKLTAEAFSMANESYDYRFDTADELTKWVRFDTPETDLLPGETKKIDYSIAVPNNAEPGGKYISVIAALDNSIRTNETIDTTQTGINSIERAASLLYITVPGDLIRTGKLVAFNLSPFALRSQQSWSVRLHNTGTVHYRTGLIISIKTLWGTAISSETKNNLLLPGTIREITGQIDTKLWPGIYLVSVTAGLGDSTPGDTQRILIVQPFILLVVLLLLIWLMWPTTKHIRKRTRARRAAKTPSKKA